MDAAILTLLQPSSSPDPGGRLGLRQSSGNSTGFSILNAVVKCPCGFGPKFEIAFWHLRRQNATSSAGKNVKPEFRAGLWT